MRVNVAGYSGAPTSLLCAFDPNSDVLLVSKSVPYESIDRPGFLRITTQDQDVVFDALFTEDDSRDAIVAYFSLDAMKLLTLADNVKQFDPRNAIERDGMDEGGMKYRIRPEINNGQVGVLIASFYAKKQREVAAIESFMDVFTTI